MSFPQVQFLYFGMLVAGLLMTLVDGYWVQWIPIGAIWISMSRFRVY
jgi:hypothetical protein